jgi:hypothetical protein
VGTVFRLLYLAVPLWALVWWIMGNPWALFQIIAHNPDKWGLWGALACGLAWVDFLHWLFDGAP